MGDGKMWNVKEKISLYEREETFFKHIRPIPNIDKKDQDV